MQKLQEDGKIAVLYSPSFGAGWYTWNREYPDMVFDPMLVRMVEKEEYDKALTYATMRWPDAYFGGLEDLRVKWVPVGTLFRITEYDGNESIELKESDDWMVA
jgi:hypothetical protein